MAITGCSGPRLVEGGGVNLGVSSGKDVGLIFGAREEQSYPIPGVVGGVHLRGVNHEAAVVITVQYAVDVVVHPERPLRRARCVQNRFSKK